MRTLLDDRSPVHMPDTNERVLSHAGNDGATPVTHDLA